MVIFTMSITLNAPRVAPCTITTPIGLLVRAARSASVSAAATIDTAVTAAILCLPARCFHHDSGTTIATGQTYNFVAIAVPHNSASAMTLASVTVTAIAHATSAQAIASLLARTTSDSHVGTNGTSAAAAIPAVPNHRSPITAVATTQISAKTALTMRQPTSELASGATSE